MVYNLILPLVKLCLQVLYTHRYALLEMLMSSRVYRSDDCSVDALLTAIRGGLGSAVLRLGPAHIWQTFAVHQLVISFRPFTVIVSTLARSYGADSADLTVTVYRLAGSPPIVPDPAQRPLAEPGNTVEVIESSNSYEESFPRRITERVVNRDATPPAALAFADRAFEKMLAYTKSGGDGGKVFLLSGPPGCGKSISARMFASHIGATLAPDYQATNRKSTMSSLTDVTRGGPLVMVADEFDNSLAHIVSQSGCAADTGSRKTHADAYDKPTWNGLLDRIHRRQNIVLILITNMSFDDIHGMVNGDMSLLRRGRIDMHFVYDDGDVRCVDPIEVAHVKESKVQITAESVMSTDSSHISSHISSHLTSHLSSRVSLSCRVPSTAHDSAMSRVCGVVGGVGVETNKKSKFSKLVRSFISSVFD